MAWSCRCSRGHGRRFPSSPLFPAPGLAIAGQVTVDAHIIETGTRSYHLATSKTARRKPAQRPGWSDQASWSQIRH